MKFARSVRVFCGLMVAGAGILLSACAETQTVTPTPMGQLQTPTTPYITSGSVHSGAAKTMNR